MSGKYNGGEIDLDVRSEATHVRCRLKVRSTYIFVSSISNSSPNYGVLLENAVIKAKELIDSRRRVERLQSQRVEDAECILKEQLS